jgi:hypothetical protein
MASHNGLDSPDFYAVAWITAFPIERAAAEAMLDEAHAAPSGFTRYQSDANIYTRGTRRRAQQADVNAKSDDYGNAL